MPAEPMSMLPGPPQGGDPESPARSGLSFVLIPTDAPGVTITPIDHVNLRYTLSSDVHFDEVRLPASAIVGGPEKWNQGWKMLAGRPFRHPARLQR
eukprot:gene32845-43912_t